MKYFIKNINEDFILHWLQTVGAVVTIRCSEKVKRKKLFEQNMKIWINLYAQIKFLLLRNNFISFCHT